MELKSTTTLLTNDEFAVIETLQNDPDPTSRLRSNYYSLRQREILTNYQADIAACNYYGDRVSIQSKMMEALKDLRKEYEADINHAIALHTSTLNVWNPWNSREAEA